MTIAATNSVTHHTATGGEDTYTFSWPFNSTGDIRVATCLGDTYTELALTTGFTVTNPALDGGTVTIVAGNPTVDTIITIYRDEDFIQDSPFKNNSAFSRELSENRLDQNVMYDQDKDNQVNRCFPRIHGSDARDVDTQLPGEVVEGQGDSGIVLAVDRKSFTLFPNIAIAGRAGQAKVEAEASAAAAAADAAGAASTVGSAEAHAADAAAAAADVVPIRAAHGMVITSVKTASFTAEVGKINLYDPTGGTFTITMPESTNEGDKLAIKNGTGAMLPVTVAAASGDDLDGLSSIKMLYPYQSLYWMDDSAGTWLEYSTYDEGYDTALPELRSGAKDTKLFTANQKFGYPDVIALTMENERRYFTTGSQSMNLASSGLGGLDTGSVSSGTWYYVYMVPKNQYELGIIASASDPDTGPTGYSLSRYIGAVRTDGSSNVVKFTQAGNIFWQKYTHNQPWPININAFNNTTYNRDEWHPQSSATAWYQSKPATYIAVFASYWWDSDGTANKNSYVDTFDHDADGDSKTVPGFGGRCVTAKYNDSNMGRQWIGRGEHDELFWAFDNQGGGQNCDLRLACPGWMDGYLP